MKRALALLATLLAGCGDAGASWQPVFDRVPAGALTCAWASGNELFVTGGADLGGGGGLLLHYDGNTWSRMANPAPALLWWAFGFAPGDVWAVGQNGPITHYDGAAWSATPVPAAAQGAAVAGVWAAVADDGWAGGA